MRPFAIPLAIVLALLPGAAIADSCWRETCNLATLRPVFARLDAARARTPGARPVHIIQIGDSHTAGDVLTGAWRDLLQARYGNGGRGVLAAGRPWDGYITHGVTATMSPGWRTAASFGKGSDYATVPLGLSSYSLTSLQPGATIGLTSDSPAMDFDRFVLCAMAGPNDATLTVRLGGADQRITLDATVPTPRCTTIRSATPQSSVTVTAGDRPTTITSWATFHDQGGVVLSNLGVVGAQLRHFGRTDDAVIAEELRAYTPDLIVLAFGTNEGFSPHFDPRDYETVLRGQIDRLRTLAPGVPLLMLGAPDALTRNQALKANADGALLGCPDAVTPPLIAPPALGRVRGIQRDVARNLGIAFWDWQTAMGGPCAARAWTNAVPPMMRPDHVHFRWPGGQALAARLQADLDAAMSE
ncbi:GDSL-type esterase/lipase family protein [Sphingomonas mali]|uniref:GDSL-type esterase/lipase family protein n=1 Tax=Sphingomonas mali TaxID=40682 RepID=UPI00083071D1|nr:GDSL-type esterase/lipase family protein [Sphingomonas mali]